MSLVKWFRKNNAKLMAIVVIILMIAFIGGSSLTYLLQPKGSGLNETFATMLDGKKITNADYVQAGREMEILKNLGTENIFKMLQYSMLKNVQDIHAIALSELLFSEQKASPEIINALTQMITSNLYRVSENQIGEIYNRTMANTIYWLCLSKEADAAGIKVSNEAAGNLLGRVIPNMYNGATYSQFMNSVVRSEGVSESQILATFAKLLGVLYYSHLVCTSQDTTLSQIKHVIESEQTMDIDFVRFDSAVFAKSQPEPDEQSLLSNFNKYKSSIAGQVSADNPYGFGYKLPDRIQFEYIALKLKDVSQIVKQPSQDEMEEFYNKHKAEFTSQVLSDPNDPNSPLKQKTMPYSSISQLISKELLTKNILSKAQSILQDAMTLTEAGVKDYNEADLAKLSIEKLAEIAGNYDTVAGELGKKYNIKLYTGKTGLLSVLDLQKDKYLSSLDMAGVGGMYVPLVDVAFAVEQLGTSNMDMYNLQKPRMFQNIGPLLDSSGRSGDVDKQVMAVMRIVEANKAIEPQELGLKYSTASIVFEPNQAEAEKNIFSVKEKVTENIKKLAAMESTKTKAEEFLEQVTASGWESTIKKFNQLYATKDVNEPFKLETKKALPKISGEMVDTMIAQYQGNPRVIYIAADMQASRQMAEKLYSLIPADANTVKLDSPIEFKPYQSYYCVKNLSVKRKWKEDFEREKAIQLYKQEISRSQSLAFVHLNPANILKRTNFQTVK
jgi:hypothetical protein